MCREREGILATATVTQWETIQDLVEALGNIPLSRIRLNPPPGQATEADVIHAKSRHHRLCELVDGVLVEKPMGYRESLLALYLAGYLIELVDGLNLGVVSGADGMMRLFPGLVRIPDVAFASWDRFPGRKIPQEPIPSLVPDLAIEVLSESNTVKEMERKRGEYFASGVCVVWEVDPRSRSVTVYTPDGSETTCSSPDHVVCGDILPGFSLDLDELFGKLDRQG
jgi:Uma2 family endonuclease